jgi:hypothetical protein
MDHLLSYLWLIWTQIMTPYTTGTMSYDIIIHTNSKLQLIRIFLEKKRFQPITITQNYENIEYTAS